MMKPKEAPLGLLLARVSRANSRAFEAALESSGGTLAIWNILMLLTMNGPLAHEKLASALGIRGATLTHHLDTMEERGLLLRVRPRDNRRRQIAELTADGMELFSKLRTTARLHDAALKAGFSASELTMLKEFLGRLASNLIDPG